MRHALAVVVILSVCWGSGTVSPYAAASAQTKGDADAAPIIVRMPEPTVDSQPAAGTPDGEPTEKNAGRTASAPPLPKNVSPAPTPAPTPSNAASAASAYQTQRLTARHFFALLPTSIFETTAEGLDESQKQELLVNGMSDFWELAGETDDVIVFTALPFRDSGVAVRLFRNEQDGSVLAAIGTLGGEMCTVELWRMDRNGRIIPVDTPQEPAVQEFFAKDAAMPKDINPSVSICLGRGGLVARPIFWNASGMVHIPLSHDVLYQWNGRQFEKQIQPHQAATDTGF